MSENQTENLETLAPTSICGPLAHYISPCIGAVRRARKSVKQLHLDSQPTSFARQQPPSESGRTPACYRHETGATVRRSERTAPLDPASHTELWGTQIPQCL